MRRIRKQWVVTDRRGRVLSHNGECLVDDGNGNIDVVTHRLATQCTGCGRPVLDVADMRGVCHDCGMRTLCVQCEVHCQACS